MPDAKNQTIGSWFCSKRIKIPGHFVRDSKGSGILRSGIVRCDCNMMMGAAWPWGCFTWGCFTCRTAVIAIIRVEVQIDEPSPGR
jgi:hypothetical protein